MQNTPTPTEKVYLDKNTFERILFILGALCFITICVLVIAYSGFVTSPHGGHPSEVKVELIPDVEILWIVNLLLGCAGAGLINPKKFIAVIPSGLFASAAMTGFTLWYISFRETLLTLEVLIPLAIGSMVGVYTYKFLAGIIYKD